MKKALISAFACDPNMGSEPYVGWNWLLQTLRATEQNVVLLTRHMHEAPILRNLPPEFHARLEILSFDIWGARSLDHRHRRMKAYYVLWQIAAFFLVMARQLTKYDISIIHQCTYNVADMPGFLWAVPGAHFIWGPIGGGQVPPSWAEHIYGKHWPRELRRARMKRLIRWNPLVIMASIKADKILVANEDTLNALPNLSRKKAIKSLETAISAPVLNGEKVHNSQWNILWVGQLESRKALQILIDAIALMKQKDPELYSMTTVTVIGTGPNEEELKNLCQNLEVEEKLKFTGPIPYTAVQQAYKSADLFAFTSVQDTSGNVLLEAMANGVPCIAFNHQGAREILSQGGGILINANCYKDAVHGFYGAISSTLKDTGRMQEMSSQAITSIEKNFLWNHKTPLLAEIYNEIQ